MAELAEPVTAPERQLRVATKRNAVARVVARVRAWPAARRFLYVLLLLYVAKQLIYVVAFPAFSGHDEVAHYAYLRTVATEHRLPVLLEDRLPNSLYRYCGYTLDWGCSPTGGAKTAIIAPRRDPAGHPLGLQYAANHPPLYYFVMTPVYWLTDNQSTDVQQFLLRLAAIPFGLATVALASLLTRTLFPGDGFLGVTVPSFIAFQPQISYEAAMVNNDIVAIALFSWILYLLIAGVRDRYPRRTCLLIGVAFGLAMLTKGTSQIAAPIIALAIVFGTGWRDVRGWLMRGVLAAVPAMLLVAPWYVFLYRTYGNLSGLPQIERIQWWNRPAGGFVELLFDREFVFMRFKETWGEFGWRLIHFDTVMHWVIALPLIIAFGGVVQYALTAGRATTDAGDDSVMRPARWQVWGLLILAATCAIAYLAVVQFGTRFLLTQARYYFPAMNAAALLVMLGLRTLIPRPYHAYGQAAIFGGLLLLNLMIFTQYVIPYWQLRG